MIQKVDVKWLLCVLAGAMPCLNIYILMIPLPPLATVVLIAVIGYFKGLRFTVRFLLQYVALSADLDKAHLCPFALLSAVSFYY